MNNEVKPNYSTTITVTKKGQVVSKEKEGGSK